MRPIGRIRPPNKSISQYWHTVGDILCHHIMTWHDILSCVVYVSISMCGLMTATLYTCRSCSTLWPRHIIATVSQGSGHRGISHLLLLWQAGDHLNRARATATTKTLTKHITLYHHHENILEAKAKLSNIKYFNLYVVSIEFFTGHLNHKCKLCPLNCQYYFNMRSTLVFKHKKCKFVRPNCRIVAAW